MGMLCNVLLREELIYPDIPRVLYSMPVPAIARHVTLCYITPLCVTVEHPVTSRCQIFTQVCYSAPYYIRRASSRRYICLWVLYITRVLHNTMSYNTLLYNMVLHNWVLCTWTYFCYCITWCYVTLLNYTPAKAGYIMSCYIVCYGNVLYNRLHSMLHNIAFCSSALSSLSLAHAPPGAALMSPDSPLSLVEHPLFVPCASAQFLPQQHAVAVTGLPLP